MCLCEYSPVATFINTFIKRSPARVRARALARASNLCTNTLDLYSRLCVARVASLHAAAQTHARAHTHRAERAGAYNASPKMLRCSLVYPPAPRLQTQSAFGIAIWRTQISAEFSNSAEHVRTRAHSAHTGTDGYPSRLQGIWLFRFGLLLRRRFSIRIPSCVWRHVSALAGGR